MGRSRSGFRSIVNADRRPRRSLQRRNAALRPVRQPRGEFFEQRHHDLPIGSMEQKGCLVRIGVVLGQILASSPATGIRLSCRLAARASRRRQTASAATGTDGGSEQWACRPSLRPMLLHIGGRGLQVLIEGDAQFRVARPRAKVVPGGAHCAENQHRHHQHATDQAQRGRCAAAARSCRRPHRRTTRAAAACQSHAKRVAPERSTRRAAAMTANQIQKQPMARLPDLPPGADPAHGKEDCQATDRARDDRADYGAG